MRLRSDHIRARGLAVAFAATLAFGTDAAAAIYKCQDAGGRVTYTDIPCGGDALDLHVGNADPQAIEQLAQRQQAASERYARDRAIAQRQAFEMQMAEAQRVPTAPPLPPPDVVTCDYCGSGFGYFAPPDRPRHRDRKPPRRLERFLPAH